MQAFRGRNSVSVRISVRLGDDDAVPASLVRTAHARRVKAKVGRRVSAVDKLVESQFLGIGGDTSWMGWRTTGGHVTWVRSAGPQVTWPGQ